jgi:hypothetical protein
MKGTTGSRFMSGLLIVVVAGCLMHWKNDGAWAANLSRGQTVYVPVYNAVRIGEQGHAFHLAATLCIRNTDRTHAVTIIAADYHGSDGKLLRRFLDAPIQLAPLGSKDFFIKASDMAGGLYPSFIVQWNSTAKVSEPAVEGVMIGDRSGQGISFISRGRVIEDASDLPETP